MNIKDRVSFVIKEAKRVGSDGGSVEMFRGFLEREIKEAITEDRQRVLAASKAHLNSDTECLQKAARALAKTIDNLEVV